MTAGPTPLPPAVSQVMAEPMLYHRAPAFVEVYARVLQRLKAVFQTENDVLAVRRLGLGRDGVGRRQPRAPGRAASLACAAASSASAGPSSARPTAPTRRTTRPSGAARSTPPSSSACSPRARQVEVVFTTLSETSTGVVNDIQGARRGRARHGALIAVDAVSASARCAAPGRVGRRRGRGGLAEGADVPARPRVRERQRSARSSRRRRSPGRRYYFDWARTVERPAQGPAGQPVHARRGPDARARRRARADRGARGSTASSSATRCSAAPRARPPRRSSSTCSAPRRARQRGHRDRAARRRRRRARCRS